MQTSVNYFGNDIKLTDDVQIVKGVVGNALYFPFGCGVIDHENNFNDVSFSLWRKWDGVADDDYKGLLETFNVKIYFEKESDKLKIELLGLEPIILDVIDESGDFIHWIFTFSKNNLFRAFRNEKLICKYPIKNFIVDLKTNGLKIGGGRTHASFDLIRTDYIIYKDSEIRGLHRLKSNSLNARDVREIASYSTPKYLGTVHSVPTTSTVVIIKGEVLGAIKANKGDWVLMTETVGGWKKGLCYSWSGITWKETQNIQKTITTLEDSLELCRHAGKDENIPAISFTKKLVALDAFIENLSAKVIYFQKSVASLVSDNPNIGDQIIYMGHNYRQYNPNEPFEFGIDELSYKDYNNDIEVWRKLMNTKQIKNIAGLSILSLFLTGCVKANGGFELPLGNAISENKIELENFSVIAVCATSDNKIIVTLKDGGGNSSNIDYDKYNTYYYSDDRGISFKKITPKNFTPYIYIITYQNNFYAIKKGTKELWTSKDCINWIKNSEQPNLEGDNDWYCSGLSHESLCIINTKTAKEYYMYGNNITTIHEDLPQGKMNSQPKYCRNEKVELVCYPRTQDYIKIRKNNEWINASISGGLEQYDKKDFEGMEDFYNENHKDLVYLKDICVCNNIFYAVAFNKKGYFMSSDGEHWSANNNDYKILKMFPKDNNVLFVAKNTDNQIYILSETFKKNIDNNFDDCSFYYNKDLKSFILCGSNVNNKAFLYLIPANIQVGSGITELNTSDKSIIAKFGNGLQIATYMQDEDKPAFIGKEWTFSSGQNTLTIGKWF